MASRNRRTSIGQARAMDKYTIKIQDYIRFVPLSSFQSAASVSPTNTILLIITQFTFVVVSDFIGSMEINRVLFLR